MSPPASNPTTPTATKVTTRLSTTTTKPRRRQQALRRRDPRRHPEDELETWVDYIKRATHKVDDLLAANKITSWIHEDRETNFISKWNPAVSTKQKGYWKQGRSATRCEERHDLAYHSGRQLEMGYYGRRFHKQQTQTTDDSYHHDNDNRANNTRTNNVHD